MAYQTAAATGALANIVTNPMNMLSFLMDQPPEGRQGIFCYIDQMLLSRSSSGVIPQPHQGQFGNVPLETHLFHWMRLMTPRELDATVAILKQLFLPGAPTGVATHMARYSTMQQRLQLEPNPTSDNRNKREVEELLKLRTHKYSSLIKSYQHSLEMELALSQINNKRGRTDVAGCLDFPENLEVQKRLVRQLFDAMLDTTEVIDDVRLQRTKSDKKRKRSACGGEEAVHEGAGACFAENVHVKRVKNLKDVEVEIIAWKLLYAAKNAQDGNVNIATWSDSATWKYDEYGTFGERFEALLVVCKHSKAMVHSMTEVDFLHRIAAGPEKEYKRKVANKDINRTRDLQVKAGIQALQAGHVRVEENFALRDGIGQQIAPGHALPRQLAAEIETIAHRTKQASKDIKSKQKAPGSGQRDAALDTTNLDGVSAANILQNPACDIGIQIGEFSFAAEDDLFA